MVSQSEIDCHHNSIPVGSDWGAVAGDSEAGNTHTLKLPIPSKQKFTVGRREEEWRHVRRLLTHLECQQTVWGTSPVMGSQ